MQVVTCLLSLTSPLFNGRKVYLIICSSHVIESAWYMYVYFTVIQLHVYNNSFYTELFIIHAIDSSNDSNYSSKDEGTKDFVNGSIHFGWDTIVDVYKRDFSRAKQTCTCT